MCISRSIFWFPGSKQSISDVKVFFVWKTKKKPKFKRKTSNLGFYQAQRGFDENQKSQQWQLNERLSLTLTKVFFPHTETQMAVNIPIHRDGKQLHFYLNVICQNKLEVEICMRKAICLTYIKYVQYKVGWRWWFLFLTKQYTMVHCACAERKNNGAEMTTAASKSVFQFSDELLHSLLH